MKESLSIKTLAAGLVLAMVFTFSSCASGRNYAIPENKRKVYEEVVDIPEASAEDILKKIRLYLINHIDEDYFVDSQTEKWETKIQKIFNEGSNHIAFKPIKEPSDAIFSMNSKNKVTKIEVFISAGQYRVVGTPIDSVKAKDGEFDKELDKLISEMDKIWKEFTEQMKLTITKQLTDEDFGMLMLQGRKTFDGALIMMDPGSRARAYEQAGDLFCTAAVVRPDDVKAMLNCGASLHNAGVYEVETALFVSQGKMGRNSYKKAVQILNKALYVYGFMPPGDPEVAKIISEIQQLKQKVGW